VYAAVMLVMLNYWMSTWAPAAANPCPFILGFILGHADLSSVMKKIVAQIFAGCIVYTFYIKQIWSLGLQAKHLERLATASQCQSHLQVWKFNNVPSSSTFSTNSLRFFFVLGISEGNTTPRDFHRGCVYFHIHDFVSNLWRKQVRLYSDAFVSSFCRV